MSELTQSTLLLVVALCTVIILYTWPIIRYIATTRPYALETKAGTRCEVLWTTPSESLELLAIANAHRPDAYRLRRLKGKELRAELREKWGKNRAEH